MRVLAVSPHLDDAAFSVGGTLAALADAGHEVTVLTCFTATVPNPAGFALACQLDKGLGPDVDYLALRRAEDAAAMAVLGATPVHLGLLEAPHRGYTSAPDLFAGVHPGDDVWRSVAEELTRQDADLWLAPQALGGHVDHLQVLRAVAGLDRPVLWWRDSPYVLRDPAAVPGPDLPAGLAQVRLPQDLERRGEACARYATQLGFQFGGATQMRAALAGLPEVLLGGARARAVVAGAADGAAR
ncbi:PIG-L deacetylase family protein [Geodermatophilus sp. DSM 44513]|uniref:PIG-L deacetylase family protein n=1 Tax=Geodermatophilus sp. DSM 44513 TaxID=1528104 RepID=UPI00126BC304|nr:PIG-L family deacetylase [Geodermatophilus sp. DSM 44513]WNV76504.1 PIG-L family deacetylase [Geodermatophilus sp. DSM 44513]